MAIDSSSSAELPRENPRPFDADTPNVAHDRDLARYLNELGDDWETKDRLWYDDDGVGHFDSLDRERAEAVTTAENHDDRFPDWMDEPIWYDDNGVAHSESLDRDRAAGIIVTDDDIYGPDAATPDERQRDKPAELETDLDAARQRPAPADEHEARFPDWIDEPIWYDDNGVAHSESLDRDKAAGIIVTDDYIYGYASGIPQDGRSHDSANAVRDAKPADERESTAHSASTASEIYHNELRDLSDVEELIPIETDSNPVDSDSNSKSDEAEADLTETSTASTDYVRPVEKWNDPDARRTWVDEWIGDPNHTKPVTSTADWAGYQRTHAGAYEVKLETDDINDTIMADGIAIDSDSVVAVETKYIVSSANSMYEGKASPRMQEILLRDFDKEITRYGNVVRYDGNPIGRLRIITNTPAAAEFLGDRTRRILGKDVDIDIQVRQ